MMTLSLVLAGLMGAAGVVLAALGAHSASGSSLSGASQILLFHALAVLCISALWGSGRLWHNAAALATAGWIVGGGLFAGDIALRAFAEQKLFAMAAPTGGALLIVGWLLFAVSAIVGRR